MKIRIRRGLEIKLPGVPEQKIDDARVVPTVALVAEDYEGLRPALAVSEGEAVRAGQALFTDRRHPEIRFTAPASGRVLAIHRGARRRLKSVVVEVDDEVPGVSFAAFTRAELGGLAAGLIRRQLLESGIWTAFRSRPFDRVPGPAEAPAAIVVSAIDTNPCAADPAAIIGERPEAFADGVGILARLAERVFVCTAPSARFPVPSTDNVESVEFAGAHPAGLPGTHIAALAPVSEDRRVWHVGYQDVIAVRDLFVTGQLPQERIAALGGPGAARPRLVRTRPGASLAALLEDERRDGARVLSGSVLAGRAAASATAYLGRYDTQVSLLDATEDTALNVTAGPATERPGLGGMLALEAFERVWPFRTPVLALLRALLIGDADAARALGCLNLAAEDLALCAYVCPAGLDYGAALRSTLSQIDPETRH